MAARILIVDDEVDLLNVTAVYAELDGHTVLRATSGAKALDILKKESVDLVISDIRMDDGDGLFLLAEAQRILPDAPPIVLVTGYAEISQAEAKSLGAYALIEKPATFQQIGPLLQRIGRLNAP